MLALALNLLTIFSSSSSSPFKESNNKLNSSLEGTSTTTESDAPTLSSPPVLLEEEQQRTDKDKPKQLYITFFLPAAPQSQTVVDNEIQLFKPSEDVRRRLKVIMLGAAVAAETTNESTQKDEEQQQRQEQEQEQEQGEQRRPKDIVLDEVSRRRADWHGQVQRLLAEMPVALKSLRSSTRSSSFSGDQTTSREGGGQRSRRS